MWFQQSGWSVIVSMNKGRMFHAVARSAAMPAAIEESFDLLAAVSGSLATEPPTAAFGPIDFPASSSTRG